MKKNPSTNVYQSISSESLELSRWRRLFIVWWVENPLKTQNELSFCNKHWFSNPFIFATESRDLWYFKLWILLNQMFEMLKVYIIRLQWYRDENSLEFVAKTQFLCVVCWVMLDYVGSILSLSVEEVIYFLLDLRIYRRTVNKCPISFLTSTYNTSEHKSINKTDPSFHTSHSTEPYLFPQATSLSDFRDISSPLPSHFSETFIYFFTL